MSELFEQNELSINSIMMAIHENAELLHEMAIILKKDEQELDKFLVSNIFVNPIIKSENSKTATTTITNKIEETVKKSYKSVVLHTDGGSRGNPGVAGCGVEVQYPDGNSKGFYFYLGTKTNNEAEYSALIKGLTLMKESNVENVEVFADSELMCNQINGKYKVKNENLLNYFNQVKELILSFKSFSITHVMRSSNKNADKLANMAMDKKEDGEIEFTVVG